MRLSNMFTKRQLSSFFNDNKEFYYIRDGRIYCVLKKSISHRPELYINDSPFEGELYDE